MTEATPLHARLEALLLDLNAWPDAAARARAAGMLGTLMEFHGAGLRRVLLHLEEADPGGRIMESLVRDDLIASLLLLHNLHPDDLESRIRRALVAASPILSRHGAEAELAELADHTTPRIRLSFGAGACRSSRAAARLLVERAVQAAAPDAEQVVLQENTPSPMQRSAFLPASSITLNSQPLRNPSRGRDSGSRERQ